jgi:hypothetical protein
VRELVLGIIVSCVLGIPACLREVLAARIIRSKDEKLMLLAGQCSEHSAEVQVRFGELIAGTTRCGLGPLPGPFELTSEVMTEDQDRSIGPSRRPCQVKSRLHQTYTSLLFSPGSPAGSIPRALS